MSTPSPPRRVSRSRAAVRRRRGAGRADRSTRAASLAFIAMCFGMFMAILDIQIVSASLSEIQAGLAGFEPTKSPGCRPPI